MSKSFKIDGKTYFLSANFDLVESIEDNTEIRVRKFYQSICEENERASDVRLVLACSIYGDKRNNIKSIDDAMGISATLYNEIGTSKAALAIHDLLLEAIVGEVDAKKLKSTRMYDTITTMIDSQLPSLRKVTLLWAAALLISVSSVCGIFSFIKLAF